MSNSTRYDLADRSLVWRRFTGSLQNLMVHVGFQSLYTQKPVRGGESPKETVHRLVKEHKSTLDKVTVVGHSLGGGAGVEGSPDSEQNIL